MSRYTPSMHFRSLLKAALIFCATTSVLTPFSRGGSSYVEHSTSYRAAQPEFQPFEISLGFNYLYLNDADPETESLYGGEVSAFWNLNSWLGLGGEFMADFGTDTGSTNFNNYDVDSERLIYVFGPRITVWHNEQVRLFVEALAGGVHAEAELSVPGFSRTAHADGFAAAVGLGFDWKITPNISWRVIQADYVPTELDSDWQHDVRLSTGLVFLFGR